MTRISRWIPPVTFALALSVTGVTAARPARAQTPTAPVLKVGAAEISINGRVQAQFNTTGVDEEPATEWELRRVRLEATVKVNDLVSGKIQPEFAGSRVALRDAYIRLTFDPAFQVLAGQAHRPFGIITPTSSTRILPIERGVRIRGVAADLDQYNLVSGLGYSERDVGIQVTGEPAGAPLGLSYALGYFNGPARAEAAGESTDQVVARLAVRPAERLRIGAGWSTREFLASEVLPDEDVELDRGHAWEADVEYGHYGPGLHLVGEVSYGDLTPSLGTRFFGAQGWLAYRTGAVSRAVSGVEPVLRVSYGDPNVNGRGDATGGGTLVTPGINLYLGGLNRVMLNYDWWNPDVGRRHGSFKAQFQLAF
jgi:hypothetical protein